MPAKDEDQHAPVPNPDDEAVNPPPAPPAPDDAEGTAPPADAFTEGEDIDAIELREAAEAVEAEKAEAAVKPGDGSDDDGEPPQTAAQANKGGENGQTPMIPKPRFDEVNSELDKLRQRNAFLEGALAAREQTGQQTGASDDGAQKPGQQQPANPVEAINQELLEISRQYDEGDITYTELKQKELELESRKLEMLSTAANKPQQQLSLADKMFLQQEDARLAKEHPFVDAVPDDVFDRWVNDARYTLERQMGDQWTGMPPGPEKDLMLRREVAKISDVYGPAILGMTKEQLVSGGSAEPGRQEPRLSQTAASRQAKLDKAGNMPPDTSRLTTAAHNNGIPSESEIERMSDEEIAALPAGVRAQIMERSAP